ncbi:MAG: hypothetical protein WCG26_01115 [Chloroflexales bacterium]
MKYRITLTYPPIRTGDLASVIATLAHEFPFDRHAITEDVRRGDDPYPEVRFEHTDRYAPSDQSILDGTVSRRPLPALWQEGARLERPPPRLRA